MPEVTEIKCVNPRCGHQVALIKPPAEVVQGRGVTVFVFSHGEPQHCNNCGQGYLPVLKEVSGVNFVWKPTFTNTDPVVLRREHPPPTLPSTRT